MRKPVSRTLPGAGEGKRGEAGHLAYLLRQANGVVRGEMERALAPLGLTHPQFAVLTMVRAYPGCSGADLARLSLLSPQTVNLIVRRLEEVGHLRRRAHAVHGRVQVLAITPGGRRLLRQCRDAVAVVEARLGAMVPPEEDIVVRRWLAAVGAMSDTGQR